MGPFAEMYAAYLAEQAYFRKLMYCPEDKMRKFFIYAGNHAQACFAARFLELPRTDWIFLSRYEQIAGIQSPAVIKFGTWYENNAEEKDRLECAFKLGSARVMQLSDVGR